MRYVDGTAVVEFHWRTDSGEVRARVFMPWGGDGNAINWVFQGTAGTAHLEVDCDLREGFDETALPRRVTNSEILVGSEDSISLQSSSRFGGSEDAPTLEIAEGEVVTLRLTTKDRGSTTPFSGDGHPLSETVAAWKKWTKEAVAYDGAYRDAVVRSAITLKLLIYEPSGAIVAAATTSLPEDVGGVRNWDYRYTWLRDASFTVNALYQLGCTREARRYGEWMCRTTARHGLPLRVFYGVEAETEFEERDIDLAEGYLGSRPVRVGNGAEEQLQLDSYGELLDCVSICHLMGDEVIKSDWWHFRSLVDFVADHWRDPDSGIWEVRDDPRHFTQSKAMAWVALDRGLRLARDLELDADLDRWQQEAEELRSDVLTEGIIEKHNCFGRAYGEDVADASLLTLPLVGFVGGDDPRILNTLDVVREALTPQDSPYEGLLYRYRADAGDGLPGDEGAFTICSFWLVQALCAAGQTEEARRVFEGVLSLQGDLGLFAEELDPASGAQLGNFPQAFSHIGLINAAVALRDADERP